MNIQKENDFVVKIKTSTSCVSEHISLGNLKVTSTSSTSKSPLIHRSSNSMSYSDSFDNDSPVKTTNHKKVKYNSKVKSHKTTTFYRKSKINFYGSSKLSKPNETTKKLLETNELKIKELLSENADCHRQLIEKTNEVKILHNQNKIQERCLKKINNQDADVPNIISRYNNEIHSLQELLKRNKDKLKICNKQKQDLETELSKTKLKNEKLNCLCENNELEEKEDLIKKIRTFKDLLLIESTKHTEMKRSIELMTKKHSHRICVETNKYMELNHMYKDVLNELRDVRILLKEKTKVLEMQNIYSKGVTKPPHHVMSFSNDIGMDENILSPVAKNKTKIVPRKRGVDANGLISHNQWKLRKPKYTKKPNAIQKTMIEKEEIYGRDNPHIEEKKKLLFFGDTPSEASEIEEKSEKTDEFANLHKATHGNKQNRANVDDERIQKNELLARLKQIDFNEGAQSQNPVDKKEALGSDHTGSNGRDRLERSETDEDVCERKSNDSSPCLFLPQGSAGLMSFRRHIDRQPKCKLANYDFLRSPLNNSNCYRERNGQSLGRDDVDYSQSASDCEEIYLQ